MKYEDLKPGMKIKLKDSACDWWGITHNKEYEVRAIIWSDKELIIYDDYKCIRTLYDWTTGCLNDWEIVESNVGQGELKMKYEDLKPGMKIKLKDSAEEWKGLNPHKEYEIVAGQDGDKDLIIYDDDGFVRTLSCWPAPCLDDWEIVDPPLTTKEVSHTKPVKSDGGSSSYYGVTITRASDGQTFDCEVGDIIASVFGNDFTLGNIVKACRRAYLAKDGMGKDGTTLEYDMNKIIYFANDFKKRYGEE